MSDQLNRPPLKPLHPEEYLTATKLSTFERLTSAALKQSLAPGNEHCLKTRPDGTMLDGHHRVRILRNRGEDVDALPREIIPAS